MMTPRALLQHGGKESTVQSHGRKQIQFQFLLPDFVGHRQRPAAGCGTAAGCVDQNVEAAEALEPVVMMWSAPARVVTSAWMKCAELSPAGRWRAVASTCPPPVSQAIHNRLSDPLCAAGHQDSFAGEFVRIPSDGGCLHSR
jgi:hypothetical protein